MSNVTLGISGSFGHDAAACVLRGDELVAYAEEERFTRQKRAVGCLPLRSASYCLRAAGVVPAEVDVVAISCDPTLSLHCASRLLRFESAFLESPIWNRCRPPRVVRVPHHIAHAASAHFAAGAQDAAFLVMDGHGEMTSTTFGTIRDGVTHKLFEAPISASLGHFYSSVSNHLGLGAEDVGKLMGLAAYGRVRASFKPFHLDQDGLRSAVFEHVLATDHIEAYRQTRDAWARWLSETMGPPFCLEDFASVTPAEISRRVPAEVLDLAASAQATVSDAVQHLARLARRATRQDRLVVAGGVGLNCSANGVLARELIFEDVFFMPASGDAGSSIGAAVTASGARRSAGLSVYQGPSAGDGEIAGMLRDLKVRYEEVEDPATAACEVLCRGEIVGWYQGAAEIGPRALGNRSILAVPTSEGMRDAVNRIKGRELWRPLSPALPVGDMSHYFQSLVRSPHMLVADTVIHGKRPAIPAVVHYDGSARPQSVDESENPSFARLLCNVGMTLGHPVLLNTSFNDSREPMVNSPTDAIRTFFGTALDVLFLGSFMITK